MPYFVVYGGGTGTAMFSLSAPRTGFETCEAADAYVQAHQAERDAVLRNAYEGAVEHARQHGGSVALPDHSYRIVEAEDCADALRYVLETLVPSITATQPPHCLDVTEQKVPEAGGIS